MLSRREFVAATAASLVVGPSLAQPLAAAAVVARLGDVVTLKAGDASTPVTGVAVTSIATIDVLRRAAAANANLVITHEPVFYTPNDEPAMWANSPVYLAKRRVIDDGRLVVCRLTDAWRARPQVLRAFAATLGITPVSTDGIATIPATTFGALADLARTKLGVRGGARVIGDRARHVQRVFLAPGLVDLATVRRGLAEADIAIVGEAREWEGIEYAFDSLQTNEPKGLVTLGKVASLEPGARACAEWVKSQLPEVRVQTIPAGDPYWSAHA